MGTNFPGKLSCRLIEGFSMILPDFFPFLLIFLVHLRKTLAAFYAQLIEANYAQVGIFLSLFLCANRFSFHFYIPFWVLRGFSLVFPQEYFPQLAFISSKQKFYSQGFCSTNA